MKVFCPYCKNKATLTSGKKLFPHLPDLKSKMFYVCEPCNARVGCHERTLLPFGSLAKPELRKLRTEAHKAFDLIWKSGAMDRKEAYQWLSEQLKTHLYDTHIGMFDKAQCLTCIKVSKEYFVPKKPDKFKDFKTTLFD